MIAPGGNVAWNGITTGCAKKTRLIKCIVLLRATDQRGFPRNTDRKDLTVRVENLLQSPFTENEA